MKTRKRRRIEGKTNYEKRFKLLKSDIPRLIVRKTNRYIVARLAISEMARDKILKTASSKELLLIGWPRNKIGSLKSLPAAYLVGYIIAKKIKTDFSKAILDSGLHKSVPNSRIYAVLKGAIDGGLNVEHSKNILPSEEFLTKHKNYQIMKKIKEKLENE